MKILAVNIKHLLRSFRMPTLFNIIGLSAAISTFIILIIQVNYDFNFGKHHPDAENIWQIKRRTISSGAEYKTLNQQGPKDMTEKIPGIEDYAQFMGWETKVAVMLDGQENDFTVFCIETTPSFINIFKPEIIHGTVSDHTLKAPGKGIISEKTAQRIFGHSDVVGKLVKNLEDEIEYHIDAVYRDFNDASALENGIYTYMPENRPSNFNYDTYLLVNHKNISDVREALDNYVKETESDVDPLARIEYVVQTMNEEYLYSANSRGSKRINTTLSLLAIAFVVLIIAFINFVNLSIAMVPARVKSINIHKVLGADNRALRRALAMESVVITFIAFLISIMLISFLAKTPMAEFISTDISFANNVFLYILSAAAILIVSYIVGIYTAIYATSFDESLVLKGSFALTGRGVKIRNALILLQVTAAIVLVAISWQIHRQHNFMQDYNWGFQKDNVMFVSLTPLHKNRDAVIEEMLRHPDITDWTASIFLPGKIHMSWSREFEGKHIDYFHSWPVERNFLDFFGIELVAGEGFNQYETEYEMILFNQEFLNKNDLDESIIGKDFYAFNPAKIMGIYRDVHFQSLHEPIKPLALVVLKSSGGWTDTGYLMLKLSGNNVPGAIAHVESTWKKFTNETFEYDFLDQNLNKLYIKENNIAKVVGIAGLIVVLIAIMGVYGIIVFNARFKVKEIGIRKVNGAGAWEIVKMLNKHMVYIILTGAIIAVPLAYYFLKQWMSNFVYATNIPAWLLPVSTFVILFITLIAVSWQSWKASVKNPVDAIKTE